MRNKKINISFIILTVVFLVITFLIILGVSITDEIILSNTKNYQIKKYHVVMDVHENGLIDVSEDITVDFNSSDKIFVKSIAKKSKYTNQDGLVVHKNNKISNLQISDNYEYKLVEDVNNLIIKIQSKTKEVNGLTIFKMQYTYDIGSFSYDKYDEFMFHCFDGFLDSAIKKAEVTINMPYSLNDYKVNFYKDYYRNINVNKYVNYKVDNNSINIKYNDNKSILDSALTIDIILPSDYFKNTNEEFNLISLSLIGVVIFLVLINILMSLKKSINLKKLMVDKIDMSTISYLNNNGKVDRKTIAIIISDLVCKGYIRIREDNNKKIRLINLAKEPEKPIMPEKKMANRVMIVKKLRAPEDVLTPEEKLFIDKIFKEEYIVPVKTDISDLLNMKDDLIAKGIIEVIDDNEKDILDEQNKYDLEYQNDLDAYNRNMEKYERNLEAYYVNVKNFKERTMVEKHVFRAIFSDKDSVVISNYKKVKDLCTEIKKELDVVLANSIKLSNDTKKKYRLSISIYLSIILWLVAYLIISDMPYQYYLLYYVSLGGILLSIIMMIFSSSKMSYRKFVDREITIFKEEYLNEFNNEVNETNYYSLLSMAYAIGLTKEYLDKYQNITIENPIDVSKIVDGSLEKSIRIYADNEV